MMVSQSVFDVRPMKVGAEIVNLSLSDIDRADVRDALYRAWMDHGLLLFRFPGITNAQHLELSRVFGELERHPVPEIWAKDEPLLIELGGDKRGPAYMFDDEPEVSIGRLPWHRDTAYTKDICKGAMLRMVDVAESGGQTLFADSAKAYDLLSPEMQRRLEGLEYKATLRVGPFEQTRPGALWKAVRAATAEENPGGKLSENVTPEIKARYPSVVHPVIVTHPESGRNCLSPSPTYVDHFLGLSQADSDALLGELAAAVTRPEVTYAHDWQVDDLLLWDNRRMLHAAAGYPPRCSRKGLRTTLAGSMRTGRMFDETAAEDWPVMAD
ncbi:MULTISPECIES: TauD/TfdA dioxygenase family protein [unclassified Sphingobium]|uniref:TauD/TfdA dioxygenase family protein n=1 Tax=unclassified Sphingobium TaxID=2611147 RepID=UPI0015E6912F|nr:MULTISPECIES: TauD/TfdA family dioxygenase [unclassified Sphingobium]MBG6119947.1 taurine dioxygenase [Sphingobium sp. JAI105]